ncbi:MAG: glucan biosynthesis glucosyltransferase H, partial [Aminobacteriaceae bacterium]
AVVDPLVHGLHTSLLLRFRRGAPSKEHSREKIVEKALASGPDSLTRKEKTALLRAPHHLRELHRKVWRLGDDDAAARWGLVPPEKE